MDRKFRSRRVKLAVNENKKWEAREKLYFDADEYEMTFENYEITRLLQNNIIHRFEYSLSEKDELDTINFHVNLKADITPLYLQSKANVLEFMKEIPYIFDSSFLNYTIGFRLKKNNIIGVVFYFYPTIFEFYKYGIRGVTDTHKILTFFHRLSQYFRYSNFDEKIIFSYGNHAKKFKGISISTDSLGKITMKLYARMINEDIDKIMHMIALRHNISDFNFNLFREKYGDSCLTAIRINNNIVDGTNIYFLT